MISRSLIFQCIFYGNFSERKIMQLGREKSVHLTGEGEKCGLFHLKGPPFIKKKKKNEIESLPYKSA